MAKMTFRFNPDTGKMEASCVLETGTHLTSCPMVKFYSAGIDTKVVVDVKDPRSISVKLANVADIATARTLRGVGDYFCESCKFNEKNCKHR